MMGPILHLSFYSHCLPCDFAIPLTQEVVSISSSFRFGFALWYYFGQLNEAESDGLLVLRLYLKKSFTLLLALIPSPSILEYELHIKQSWVVSVVLLAKVSLDQSKETTSRFLTQPRSVQVPSPPFQEYKQYMLALYPYESFVASCCSIFWYNPYS